MDYSVSTKRGHNDEIGILKLTTAVITVFFASQWKKKVDQRRLTPRSYYLFIQVKFTEENESDFEDNFVNGKTLRQFCDDLC